MDIQDLSKLVSEPGKRQLKHMQNMYKAMHTKLPSLPTSKKTKPVDVQLSSAKAAPQQESRQCLIKIVGSVQVFAYQGTDLRGHAAEKGNLNQLLKRRCDDNPGLKKWMSTRKHDYISPK